MLHFDTRVLRILWTLLVCYLVYLLRDLIFLLVLAVVAAYMLLPVVEFVYRRVTHRRSRGLALAGVYLAIIAILFGAGGVIGYYAFGQAAQLARQVPDLTKPGAIENLRLPQFLGPLEPQIRAELQDWLATHGKEMLETLTSVTLKLLSAVGSLFSMLIVLLLSFLLLQNGASFARSFVRLLSPASRPKAEQVLHDEHNLLSQWTRATVLVSIVTVFIYGIGYSLLGVPYSVLLAMIVFPFEFVPMIGAPIGFLIVLGVAVFTGYHGFLWLILFFIAVRLLVDYVLQPYMMGSGEIELPPFVVIVAALAGEALAGIPGILLSIPAAATIRILYRHVGPRHHRNDGKPETTTATAAG